VIDSGCTNHLTGEESMFETLKESNDDHYITFAGNQKGKVLDTGNIDLNSKFSLSKVLLVESLGYNLLSISQLCASGFNCLFTNEGVTVIRRSDGSVAFKGVLKGKLYLVNFSQEKAQLGLVMASPTSSCWDEKSQQAPKGGSHSRTNQCFF
jgi:hypothetical protein